MGVRTQGGRKIVVRVVYSNYSVNALFSDLKSCVIRRCSIYQNIAKKKQYVGIKCELDFNELKAKRLLQLRSPELTYDQ